MVSAPICVNKVRMVQPVVTKAVLQIAKAAAMCTACHDHENPGDRYSQAVSHRLGCHQAFSWLLMIFIAL